MSKGVISYDNKMGNLFIKDTTFGAFKNHGRDHIEIFKKNPYVVVSKKISNLTKKKKRLAPS